MASGTASATVPGNTSQYVEVSAPTIAGYQAVGVLFISHNDYSNINVKKWIVAGGIATLMAENVTSGARAVNFEVRFLYL